MRFDLKAGNFIDTNFTFLPFRETGNLVFSDVLLGYLFELIHLDFNSPLNNTLGKLYKHKSSNMCYNRYCREVNYVLIIPKQNAVNVDMKCG
jgi:hypothetical protein